MLRPEPVGICISGAPGIGKTRFLVPFVTAVGNMLLNEDELEDFEKHSGAYIYNRTSEQVYWDGYAGQFFITFDDFLQAKDVAGDPDNEAMNVIRLISGFPYRPHMAGMEEKGKKEATSKVIFATSNQPDFSNVQSIRTPAALERRFALRVIMRPK